MSTSQQDTQLLQAGQLRAFIQEGVANPGLRFGYYGCLEINKPGQDLGAQEPVWCPDPSLRNSWIIVDTIVKTPSLPKFDFNQHASRLLADVWMRIRNKSACKFNLVVVSSLCANPTDFNRFDAKIAFKRCKLSKFDLGDLNVLNGDKNAVVDITGSVEAQDMYFIYPLEFEQVADATIVAEVLDAVYYDTPTCGDCGTPSDGCQKLYALTLANGGSPGLSSQIVRTIDGASTWVAIDIASLGGKSASRMAPMGSYMIVISENTDSYHYSTIANLDSGVSAFTNQATGFVTAKGPRAIYVKNSGQAYIAGVGGYIYYLTNPVGAVSVLTDGSVTTQNQNDIGGYGRTIVSVGDSNSVMVSRDDGNAFFSVTGPAVGISLSAVWVVSEQVWFVGTGNGKLYYTLNGGTTWTLVFTEVSGASVINDIQFYDDLVGYMATQGVGGGKVYRTLDGGNSWFNTGDNIDDLPANDRINVCTPCGPNQVAAGGRKASAGDGILAIAR